MATTLMEKEQKRLLKKFHTLLHKTGGHEAKEAILQSYGVESSTDLSAKDLLDICNKLSIQADPKLAELDTWRKRVIAVIFSYCKVIGRPSDMNYVKAVACRASGFDSFNKIPVARLNNLYNAFKDKIKDIKKVGSIANDDLLSNINLN